MSFASDLLDGFDTLNKRAEGVLKGVTGHAEFFHKLADIEKEYAKALSKLAQSHKQALVKASPSQKELSSSQICWDTVLNELQKISDHHRGYADKLDADIGTPMGKWVKDKQNNRKRLEGESERITKDMKTQLSNLQKARAKYVGASKDADQAEAKHVKGKGDPTMKPNQLAQLAAKASQAADRAASSDNEYQQTLSATNQKQTDFYLNAQPTLLGEFQQFEEEKIVYTRNMLEKFAEINLERPNFYSVTAESMSSATRGIKIEGDIAAFVNENKTGVTPPQDIPYISYDSEVPSQPKSKPAAKKPTTKPPAYKSPSEKDIISTKEWGLSSSDNSLSDEDKQNKLLKQIEELDKALMKEKKTKDGLENLMRFYASDPVAQKKAEDELYECDQKMKKIEDIRGRVSTSLEKLGGTAPSIGSRSTGSSGGNGVKARGLYDYQATCDTELTFREGDILTITEQDDSGWWYAELNGQAGFVPNNYVEVV